MRQSWVRMFGRSERSAHRLANAMALSLTVIFCVALPASSPAADEEPEKVAPPEEVLLETGDSLTIATTYYAGSKKLGNKVVPVMLLHTSKGNRGDFVSLALKLQRAGHAVLVPDLRGHGDSSRMVERGREPRSADYLAIVEPEGDMEAAKKFLMTKHNAGELNIEKLCLVGAELGAVVALNWAARDWDWPVLATGKQGQDVKALVLISPEWTFKGMHINEAVVDPNVRKELSIMIIAGKGNNKMLQEARRLHSAFERYHVQGGAAPELSKQTLWLKTPSTSLQGTRLLSENSLHVDDLILQFIDLRLVKQPIPWVERRRPLN